MATVHKELAHHWLAGLGCFAENLTTDWHIAPADHFEAFFGNDVFDDLFFALTLFSVLREEYEAHAVVAFSGNVETTLSRADALEEVVWQLDENTRAVTGDRVTATATAVVEVDTDFKRALHDVVGFAAFHVDD